MKKNSSLRTVGTFVKVLKKDGSLLFRPEFRDSDFLMDFNYLYHFNFKTKWKIASITKVSKGFTIRFAGVETFKEAGFFIGEKFALPESEIFGKSQDLLIGSEVFDKYGKTFGKIVSLTQTPAYSLAEVESIESKTFFVPFTENFFKLNDGTVTLLSLPQQS